MYNIINNYKNAQNNCANVQMFSITFIVGTRDVSHFKYTILNVYACI